MTSIVEALIKQGAPLVLTLGPLTYRVNRVNSLDMLNAGAGTLLAAVAPAAPDNSAAARAARKAPTAPQADAMVSATRFADGMVCASVDAISVDSGTTWQAVTIVADRKQESAEAGRLFVGNLLPGHAQKLYAAALAHSTDGEEAAKQLASFLGGADPDASRAGE